MLPEQYNILLEFPLHRTCVIVNTRAVHATCITAPNITCIDVQDLFCLCSHVFFTAYNEGE